MDETPQTQCGSDARGAVERDVQLGSGLVGTGSDGVSVGFASEGEGGE